MQTNIHNFDYFYGIEADQFSFYRIPKELFTNTYFKGLSAEAKILYGLMLDRMSLSRKNNWLDAENRVYIIFKNEEVKEELSCGNDKASKLFAELEKYNLISRKKRGQGHPSLIFVKNIYSSISNDENADVNDEDADSDNEYVPNSNQQDFNEDEQGEVASQNDYTDFNGEYYEFEKFENRNSRNPKNGTQDFREPEFKTSENRNSRNPKNGTQDFRKSECNNTNIINTEFSDINLNITNQTIPNNCKDVSRVDKVELYEKYFEVIKKNIDYDYLVSLKHFCPSEIHRINEILNIITDMVVFNDKPVLINAVNYPPEIIKSVFMKLNSRNILYVLNSLDESKAEIKNIKKYIISMLYNSRFSIENYNTVKDNLEYC